MKRFSALASNPGKNRGAALFIGLMILLLLTLLGLSSSNVSMMQERMAGNVSQYNDSFQVAESVLREVESRIYQGICLTGASGGLGTIPQWSSLGLELNDCTLSGMTTPASSWIDAPDTVQPGGEGWAKYFIVELPPQPRCHAANSNVEGNLFVGRSYAVLASGRAPDGHSEAIVQSIVTCIQG